MDDDRWRVTLGFVRAREAKSLEKDMRQRVDVDPVLASLRREGKAFHAYQPTKDAARLLTQVVLQRIETLGLTTSRLSVGEWLEVERRWSDDDPDDPGAGDGAWLGTLIEHTLDAPGGPPFRKGPHWASSGARPDHGSGVETDRVSEHEILARRC